MNHLPFSRLMTCYSVNCNALPCEGGLSKTIGGGGNLKENHSFMNIQGSYAEVGAKVIKGDRYDYSYSLSPENLDQAEATHSLNVGNIYQCLVRGQKYQGL